MIRARPANLQFNSAHPLADALVWAVAGGAPYTHDIVAGGQGTALASSGITWDGVTEMGAAISSTVTGNGGIKWPFPEKATTITTQHTIIAWANPVTLGTYAKLLSIPYYDTAWSSPFTSLGLQRYSSGSTMEAEIVVGSTIYSAISDSNMIANGNGLTMYAVTRNGANVVFYRNGVQHGAAKTINAGTVNFGEKSHVLTMKHQEGQSSTWFAFSGQIAQLALFNQALTAEQMLSQYNDAWALFRRDVIVLNAPPATVSVGTIASTSAAYAPTVSASIALSVGTVAGASAAYAPTLSADASIAVGTVAGASVAYAPTVSASATVAVSNATSTGAAYAPTLSAAYTLAVGAISGAGTAYAPSTSAAIALSVGMATSTGVAYAPTLETGVALEIGAIASASSAYAPTLSASIALAVGNASETGQAYAPTVSASIALSVGTVASESDAYAPSVVSETTLAVAHITSASTAYAPTVSASIALTVGTITSVSQAHAVTISASYPLAVGTASSSGAAYAPSVSASIALVIGIAASVNHLYTPVLNGIEAPFALLFSTQAARVIALSQSTRGVTLTSASARGITISTAARQVSITDTAARAITIEVET